MQDRREFLKKLGLGVGAAAAIVVTPKVDDLIAATAWSYDPELAERAGLAPQPQWKPMHFTSGPVNLFGRGDLLEVTAHQHADGVRVARARMPHITLDEIVNAYAETGDGVLALPSWPDGYGLIVSDVSLRGGEWTAQIPGVMKRDGAAAVADTARYVVDDPFGVS